MCGIAGFIAPFKNKSELELDVIVRNMASAIVHRGPDDGAIWCDKNMGLALAHRRLSILDLSAAGRQPMHSHCGRYVIIFNGEIYNHLTLRDDLERSGLSTGWAGHSDTETLLECFSIWGIEKTLNVAVGMFAFALWDRREQTLSLARDRFGEKPLYFGWQAGCLLFASELKALTQHPAWKPKLDKRALALYLRHNYVPAPHTIYADIRKLEPGKLVCWRFIEGGVEEQWPTPVSYWSAREVFRDGVRARENRSKATTAECEKDSIDSLEALLRESIRGQMISDVPLGAFLSGGVDSSLVVALMQQEAVRPVRTFTIGFEEKGYNEAPYAKAVATHLKTEHHELYVSSRDAVAVVPLLPQLYDEPFADSSQIPTCLLSRMTRESVTVSLSGDGGDELFGGYSRYFVAGRLWDRLHKVPAPLRGVAASVIRALPVSVLDRSYDFFAKLFHSKNRLQLPGERLHKAAGILTSKDGLEVYERLLSYWDPTALMLNPVSTDYLRDLADPTLPTLVDQMMAIDIQSYLSEDIMVKLDRAAMAFGLETRAPLLDHRISEFACKLPLSMKIRNGQGKWILRRVLDRFVPSELIDRPKMGFGVPIDSWLRGPLRDWAESLIDLSGLRAEGIFHPEPIRRAWEEHLSGRRNWSYHLWGILMFQAWLRAQKEIDCS
ncbi:AsnB Asparagine synthase (glutamine-hydrolyzing) [Burkholderiaceae bacterium]